MSAYTDVTFYTPAATPVNHAPVLSSPLTNLNWTENTPYTQVVGVGTFTDPDGDVLRVTAVGNSMLGGAVSINANGTVRYISRVGAMGMDMFSYTITDTAGNTATAQISVTIGMNPGD